jgi:hypothetical protein
MTVVKPTAAADKALRKKLGAEFEKYDASRLYTVTTALRGGRVARLKIPKEGLRAMLLFTAPKTAAQDVESFTVVQEDANGAFVGGNTFALRTVKATG